MIDKIDGANTLLIHIGMPKTGTTSLQNFLYLNNGILEEYGWCYPVLMDGEMEYWKQWELEGSGNGYDLYDYLIISNVKSEWDKRMDISLRYLKDKNVILSAESIYEFEGDKFIAAVKERYAKVKVIVYLRRQDRAIESLYNQRIKNGTEHRTFEEFIGSDGIPPNFLDYLFKLNSISKIIGKSNLIVRIYEKQQLVDNDTVMDFLSVLGIPLDRNNLERSSMKNISLGGNYLEINRLTNSIRGMESHMSEDEGIDWKVKSDFRDICAGLSNLYNKDQKECGFFTMDERERFLRKFVEDNEQVAREYLHREEGILFYDDRMDYPLYEINQSSGIEADMIRIFTEMIYAQARRITNLVEKMSRDVIGKFMMKDVWQKSNNRKLMLFGAGYNCQKLIDILGDISGVSITDNDKEKQGMVFRGVTVSYAKEIMDWLKYFVIVTCQKTEEIEKQLSGLGLKKDKDYVLLKEYGL